MAELRELARAATPGPWERLAGDEGRRIWSEPLRVLFGSSAPLVARVESNRHHADAAYIAAMSPDVTLGLLDRLRDLEAVEEAARRLCLYTIPSMSRKPPMRNAVGAGRLSMRSTPHTGSAAPGRPMRRREMGPMSEQRDHSAGPREPQPRRLYWWEEAFSRTPASGGQPTVTDERVLDDIWANEGGVSLRVIADAKGQLRIELTRGVNEPAEHVATLTHRRAVRLTEELRKEFPKS